ncbi:MAG TPA: TRIC cation channel family protein [Burkholderiales bacterium]|nr:TRIC cation channel family protein [Burkholderiales bacterium]
MIGVAFQLPIWFDLGAVFLLALTGVWAAGRRGYDVVGAFIMAFVTGVGGGLLRDAVFLQEIPLVMQDVRYLWAVIAAVLVGALTHRLADRFEQGISYVDATATGAYGVYGANKALLAGLAPEAALLVGVCNAVGGGLIRDVLVREEPVLLKPGTLFAVAALVGCLGFVLLSYQYGIDTQSAAWIAILMTLLIRILAVRFNWTTHAIGRRHRRKNGEDG